MVRWLSSPAIEPGSGGSIQPATGRTARMPLWNWPATIPFPQGQISASPTFGLMTGFWATNGPLPRAQLGRRPPAVGELSRENAVQEEAAGPLRRLPVEVPRVDQEVQPQPIDHGIETARDACGV